MSLMGRIYNDYLMRGRWECYRDFLIAVLSYGYKSVRHQDAKAALAENTHPIFLLRHDIDTDPINTRIMFNIEREVGISSTYYFRRCTVDMDLMNAIIASGGEVGYHYEELSDYIKTHGKQTKDHVLSKLSSIRENFIHNFHVFEDKLGAKVHTIAAHGDFINRRVGLDNKIIINEEVRSICQISLEAYDDLLANNITFRATDQMYPALWNPSSPIEAIKKNSPAILVLVHPRHWQRAPLHRLQLDIKRLYEDVRYHLR